MEEKYQHKYLRMLMDYQKVDLADFLRARKIDFTFDIDLILKNIENLIKIWYDSKS